MNRAQWSDETKQILQCRVARNGACACMISAIRIQIIFHQSSEFRTCFRNLCWCVACSTLGVPYPGPSLSGRETERSGAKNYQKRPWGRVGGLASRALCLCGWGAGIGHVPSIPGDEQMELGGFGAFAQAGRWVVGLPVVPVPQVPFHGENSQRRLL